MMNPCLCCGQRFEGLNWFIPDEAWLAIAGSLSAGEMCPWCANKKLQSAGINVRAKISLSLSNFDAFNLGVISELERLDSRVLHEQLKKDNN